MRTIPAINQAWPEQGGIYVGSRFINGAVHHIITPAGTEHDAKGIAFKAAAEAIPTELNGHSDWRLPEKEDLMLAYINSREHFEQEGIGSIYWSSTVDSDGDPWAVDFEYGSTNFGNRISEFRVRPFRSFADSTL